MQQQLSEEVIERLLDADFGGAVEWQTTGRYRIVWINNPHNWEFHGEFPDEYGTFGAAYSAKPSIGWGRNLGIVRWCPVSGREGWRLL